MSSPSRPLVSSLTALLLLWGPSCATPTEEPFVPPPPLTEMSGDRFTTTEGPLILHPINHATLALGWAGQTFYVDPVGPISRFQGMAPPDVVFVTDIHSDHLSAETLATLVEPSTVIVAPQAVKDLLPEALQIQTQVMVNGGTLELGSMGVQALPMYNLTPGRDFHTKGRGNGYVLTMGGRRLYIAGDTEDVPEMRALRDIDVALIPMNLPYTMTVQQAADAVRAFKPTFVYPYHSRGSDLAEFTRLVGTDVGVQVRVREWY